MELRHAALDALRRCDPGDKVAATHALAAAWAAGEAVLDAQARLDEPPGLPGRPLRPKLVAPRALPARSVHEAAGRAAMLHAIAHIEFNAINLALDAVWRFAGMPAAFYADWLRVADEEATHFQLLGERLAALGHAYGDFDAHDGLWAMTARTSGDVLARMALVPRTLEARGLDATPPIQAKLRAAGDAASVAVLDRILADEIGHVAIGNRWFRWLCAERGLAPQPTAYTLERLHAAPRLRPPFNFEARRAAGFDEAELAALAQPQAPEAPGPSAELPGPSAELPGPSAEGEAAGSVGMQG